MTKRIFAVQPFSHLIYKGIISLTHTHTHTQICLVRTFIDPKPNYNLIITKTRSYSSNRPLKGSQKVRTCQTHTLTLTNTHTPSN